MAKLVFDGVHLDHECPRFSGAKGQASSNTSYFSAIGGYAVTLETTTGLVTVAHREGGAIVVPRERVKRFEPKPEVPQVDEAK